MPKVNGHLINVCTLCCPFSAWNRVVNGHLELLATDVVHCTLPEED